MLRVLTRVLAVQMGKEGHISEMLCRKNLQAAESELGCEPGGGTRGSRCPGNSMERRMEGWAEGWRDGWRDGQRDGGMEGWVEGWRDGWRDGWRHEWASGWRDGVVQSCQKQGSARGRGKRWAAVF